MHVQGKLHEETHKGSLRVYAIRSEKRKTCTPSHTWKLSCHGMFTERCVSIYGLLKLKKWVAWCARLTAYTHWTSLASLVCENSCMFCNAEYADLTSDQRVLRVLAWLMSDDCCWFDEVVQDQVSDSFTGRHACNTTASVTRKRGLGCSTKNIYAPFERSTSMWHWMKKHILCSADT